MPGAPLFCCPRRQRPGQAELTSACAVAVPGDGELPHAGSLTSLTSITLPHALPFLLPSTGPPSSSLRPPTAQPSTSSQESVPDGSIKPGSGGWGAAPSCRGLGVETGTGAWAAALPGEDGVVTHRDPRAKDAGGTSTTRAGSRAAGRAGSTRAGRRAGRLPALRSSLAKIKREPQNSPSLTEQAPAHPRKAPHPCRLTLPPSSTPRAAGVPP